MERFISLLGLLLIIGAATLFSSNRRQIRWKTVAWGLGLQLLFATLVLKTDAGKLFFRSVNNVIITVLDCGKAGAQFVFGNLTSSMVPVGTKSATGGIIPQQDLWANVASFFGFTVLPTIIFFSALMAVLYHLRILQKVVKGISWVMERTMKTSGAESLSASANIFLGQTEAPLVVRPYIEKMTRSELMAVMTGGFATIAGGVMAAYVAMLSDKVPGIAGHLMAASIMAAPAGLYLTKIFMPETETSATADAGSMDATPVTSNNILDAASQGASQGLSLALNVGSMLIAFIALITLINILLGWTGGLFGMPHITLTWIFSKVFAPFGFLLGVPWADSGRMGELLGTKLAINEFVAYAQLQQFAADNLISERTMVIASYVLCGFANISSIGIQIGGLSSIAPGRRADLTKIGPRAMAAGFLASCTAACIAGLLI